MALNKNGFTLLEVLFALTIFCVCSLSIAEMLIIGKRSIANGNNSFTAVQAAKAQMELLRGSVLQTGTGDTCADLPESTITCEWSLKKDVPMQGLSTLKVTATWNEGDSNREIVLTAVRFDGG
ncbi:MAG: prepilin-type N-terminal cleavage/methylation domain-containing protein [Nitrospirae bacterium]|nr:prepilin-type N-terminal cleavage/methylation domain-containing protein [Nitrospirota bacterium]